MTIYPAILLLIALGVCSGGLAPFIVRNNLQQRYKQELRMLADQPEAIDCNSPNITENWFEQKYDQFNQTDTRTYQQHYFVNWKFHDNQTNSAQPVVFLQIGGEGEIPKRWVCLENYTYMVLAKENNAIVVQLEHRFFGKNLNMTDLSTSNLQYLTTEQALADIAAFIPAFSEANKLVNPRWVAFGGSYPGSLAAWLRIKILRCDGEDNQVHIRRMLQKCGDAFKELKKMTLTDKGRSKLSQMFHIYPPLKGVPDDITNFYGEVFNVFQGLIQYTYDARTSATLNGLNISQACNIMNENESSLVKRLADVMDWDENLESEGLRDQKSLDVRYRKA
uniref:Uncharacterized protein n=1 Tax=Ditylenchus dipsaci TaxID=166011 RepID=A0A915D4A1_9BILA